MGKTGDTLQPAYPNNSHKQDWAFYPFVGGRGGVSGVTTGVTRYSFWVDFDPFDIKNLKMLSQNVSFQIFADPILSTPVVPYFILDESNDITDEIIEANLPTVQGTSVGVGSATINYPPFGFNDNGSLTVGGGQPPTSSVVPAPTGAQAVLANGTAAGLTIGQTYYYAVTATVGGVEGLPSTMVSATPTAEFPEIDILFNNNVANVQYFSIYRSTVPSFTSGFTLLEPAYFAGQPPYYVNTTFVSQPVNTSFRTDQGNWTFNGFTGHGVGFGQTNMVGQAFVPQQQQLTGFFFKDIFHTNTNDHTTFGPMTFELWDSTKSFYKHLTTLQPTFIDTTDTAPSGLITDSSATAFCNNIDYNFGDDNNNYWIQLDTLAIQLASPIAVTPGSKYYIVVRMTPLTSSGNYYALGANYDATIVRSYLYYYPYGEAILSVDGSSSFSTLVDNNGAQITFPFTTQGNVGRYAVTFWWKTVANGASNYWFGTPNSNDYSFLHIDYNTRI